MRSLLLPLVSLALAVVSLADPVISPYVLHEKRSSAPQGWSRAGKHNSAAIIPLRFAIAQSNIENIGEYLYDISLPGSSNYGNHWTAAEIAAKFAPSHDSVDAIRSWLMQSTFAVEYTPEAYLQSDMDLFAEKYANILNSAQFAPNTISIDGGIIQTTNKGFADNGESNLDLQYGMTLVTSKQNVTMYQVGDINIGASFNNFLDAIDGSYCTFEGGDDPSQDSMYPDTQPGGYDKPQDCGTVKPANVITTSYGYNEADITPFYAARQCAEYAKLGLMGVTVLYSSGDNGVAGNAGFCLNPNGTETPGGKVFNPTFPGTCPYVTSVGATQVSPNSSVLEPESACEQVIYSSGGFSNYFAIPDYQKDAVASYLKNYPPSYPDSIWNSTGTSRAFPDLSANGANYVVAIDGNFSLVYGTSASSPVVGAILTMVNDARLATNKKPIGFINPTIYSSNFSDAFNDITNGSNPGCGTLGFNSTPGWDPVTGLGTPRFPKLLEYWLQMP
ncbi:hypothetical protein SERLA73DRAFT_159461 [Serpula lacrymans var. lacrymans S7.3]|uniref:tripeptidyl-peptidase II n=1 Tax=Serpula lacrymans var. lacrymans (strain S7.3) TaxID=936435 RepID=F8PSN1_SERL3|nr:hypothetical protein SERLA73DRAFT_159461 [Serpula lacrymans var. lacrymans S7.3]